MNKKIILLLAVITVIFVSGCVQKSAQDLKNAAIEIQLKDVVISMESGGCKGCSSYSVKLYGNGTVVYDGKDYVGVKGQKVYQIAQEKVKGLVDEFTKIDYFSLKDKYPDEVVLDAGELTISIAVGGKTKTVSLVNAGKNFLIERNVSLGLIELPSKIVDATNLDVLISQSSPISTSNEKCVNQTIDDFKTRFNTTVGLKDLYALICASDTGYLQYTIEARRDGKLVILYHLQAGTSASGADKVEDDCLILDGKKIISKRIVGINQNETQGTCTFDSSVFPNPFSHYSLNNVL